MYKNSDKVIIGKLHSTHGVKGNLKLEIFLKGFYLPKEIYIKDEEGNFIPLEIESIDRVKNLIKIKGYDTLEKAKEISQKFIYIPQDLLPKLDKDEYYEFQLLGLDVYFNGKLIGKIEKIDDRLSQVYLLIRCVDNKVRHLPFINNFIKSVNIKEGNIEISPPEGWFSL